MAKEYVVESAMISCEYGSTPIELQTPDHRHIYVDDKKLANVTDIDASCIGCFGSCSSPYVFQYDISALQRFEINTVQEARPYITDNGCMAEVVIPWQSPQPDVLAGHYPALIEGCWTVCQKGFGIISVIYSGQSPDTNNQVIIKNLKELEQAVEAYMKEHNIKSKHKDKLLESILLWDAYQQTFWERDSDEHTTGFADHLKKDNPALFNFFERKIILEDKNSGSEVDLTYFIGLTKGFNKDRKDALGTISPEVLHDRSMLNAYIDAANIEHDENIKDKSIIQLIDGYYGLSGNEGKSGRRYSTYVDYVTPLLSHKYHGTDYMEYDKASDEDKKFMILNNMISGRVMHGNEEEYANDLTKLFLGEVRNALQEERGK